MKELHIHLHLARGLLADAEGSIHIHLQPEGHAAGEKPRGRRKPPRACPQEPSGYTVKAERSGNQVSGCDTMASGEIAKPSLALEQRIRSKMYRLDAVPSADGGDLKKEPQRFLGPEACPSVILELATGNQVNPIVWESCDPNSQRGLWRLSVRQDFGRLLGIVTHARDQRAIWVVSDWTPRGTLILEPAEPQCYPRLMMTPVSAFQR